MKKSAPVTLPTPEMMAMSLVDTTRRYLMGYMVRATYREHRRAIWNRVQELGQAKAVLAILLAREEDEQVEQVLRIIIGE